MTVGGVTIPEGADVMLPINVIHHVPRYWPDPYKFDPERQATIEPNMVKCTVEHPLNQRTYVCMYVWGQKKVSIEWRPLLQGLEYTQEYAVVLLGGNGVLFREVSSVQWCPCRATVTCYRSQNCGGD